MSLCINNLHHVQLAIPAHGEDTARAFYCGVLGFDEVDKPKSLHAKGGLWLEAGAIQLHLGIDDPFVPAKKAHPAFVVRNLNQAVAALSADAVDVSERSELPLWTRVYIVDPFGNRIEILELTSESAENT